MAVLSSANIKALTYGAMNVVSASGIVFANKAVFQTYGFHFTYALTWLHTLTTLLGMRAFAAGGMFAAKPIPQRRLVPLAAAYVAYIVLCNLSLKVNTVGFYQVMKIAVAPTVIGLELLMFRRVPPARIVAAVLVVCLGIGVATVTDSQMVSNVLGIGVGMGATLVTALYQIWAGSKQRELKASSMQLLHAYTPQATIMLGLLVPLCEPMGWAHTAAAAAGPLPAGAAAAALVRPPGSLLAYAYHPAAVAAIVISAVLGLLVSLSTFLVIGATSSLTYNVVGHLKTIIILSGGCVFFGDTMPTKKLLGVCIAMGGIVWYTQQKLAAPATAAGGAGGEGTSAAGSMSYPRRGTASSLLPITSAPPMSSVKSVYTAAARSRAAAGGGGGAPGGGAARAGMGGSLGSQHVHRQ
ncbi:Solute carrier family 35 member E3 [Tetrabaena socialis]|uniref:Solute carrier family 35 member E3 n=1 Tax=Tetrabaena socialis TaxID=47790 RepID=A0A2J8A1L8_9CHLO|nr:Solute carrier family 35 member E3 [Tetrabaena socialis]|eukprot:PNH06400.1 Solute carrier family 35 member E3 [Tetrabaena socialis]